jgi:hypothetical protein
VWKSEMEIVMRHVPSNENANLLTSLSFIASLSCQWTSCWFLFIINNNKHDSEKLVTATNVKFVQQLSFLLRQESAAAHPNLLSDWDNLFSEVDILDEYGNRRRVRKSSTT